MTFNMGFFFWIMTWKPEYVQRIAPTLTLMIWIDWISKSTAIGNTNLSRSYYLT
jgi:hypothetical protein